MSRQPAEAVGSALFHLETLAAHAERGLDDQLVIDAVCMRLSAGIEAVATLAPELREELFGADWPLIWGMRNRIAHGYMMVDAEVIRETVRQDVPLMISRIRAYLQR